MIMQSEIPDDEHSAFYQRAIYLRGLFIQRYAGIEFSITSLLMLCRQHPSYNHLGDLPFKLSSKLKRLEKIITIDGPMAPFSIELQSMAAVFKQFEERRHFLVHGLMATKVDEHGERLIAFRLYNHIRKVVHFGELNMSIDELESLAASLTQNTLEFTTLASSIVQKETLVCGG